MRSCRWLLVPHYFFVQGLLPRPQPQVGRLGLSLPQHVRNDEEPDVAAADVDLLEMADAPVAGRDGNVLELHVHVVLGCEN